MHHRVQVFCFLTDRTVAPRAERNANGANLGLRAESEVRHKVWFREGLEEHPDSVVSHCVQKVQFWMLVISVEPFR